MNCPKCKSELLKVELGGVDVNQCDQCGGVWFDFGELDRVLADGQIDRLRHAVDENLTHDAQRAACPRCGTSGKMTRLKLGDLHIDSCSRCYGQWLDGGELERIKASGNFQTIADFFRNVL